MSQNRTPKTLDREALAGATGGCGSSRACRCQNDGDEALLFVLPLLFDSMSSSTPRSSGRRRRVL